MNLQVSEEDKIKIYRSFGRSKEDVDKDVEIIKEWLQTQTHLPEVLDEPRIRNFLLQNKYSIEKTKQKIDCYYTIRSIPEWFDDSNPKSPAMREALDSCVIAFGPKLLDGLYCVVFLKNLIPGLYKPREVHLHMNNLLEVTLAEHFMAGDVFVIDFECFNFDDYVKHTPALVMKLIKIYQKVFSMRMKAAYLINTNSAIMIILSAVKTIMSPKVYDRIHTSTDSSILKTVFPEDILPRDYGGTAPSLKELNEVTSSIINKHQNRFDQLDKLRVDENLRPEKLENNEFLGFHGNFKKISID